MQGRSMSCDQLQYLAPEKSLLVQESDQTGRFRTKSPPPMKPRACALPHLLKASLNLPAFLPWGIGQVWQKEDETHNMSCYPPPFLLRCLPSISDPRRGWRFPPILASRSSSVCGLSRTSSASGGDDDSNPCLEEVVTTTRLPRARRNMIGSGVGGPSLGLRERSKRTTTRKGRPRSYERPVPVEP